MTKTRKPFDTNDETFAGLFDRYKNLVYRTALLMLGTTEEAEDALQEIFIKVFDAMDTYDPQKGARTTWLHRITINYCLGLLRKRRLVSQPIDEEDFAAGDITAELEIPLLDERERMVQAINRLNEKLRVVVILRFYWELPYAEIAQILDIPVGTVKSRIDLSLKALRNLLADAEEKSHPRLTWDVPSEEKSRL